VPRHLRRRRVIVIVIVIVIAAHAYDQATRHATQRTTPPDPTPPLRAPRKSFSAARVATTRMVTTARECAQGEGRSGGPAGGWEHDESDERRRAVARAREQGGAARLCRRRRSLHVAKLCSVGGWTPPHRPFW
jgi:hypothetical protein